MKAVVTGCAGGIGNAICAELRRRSYEVIGLDRVDCHGVCTTHLSADLGRVAADDAYRVELLRDVRSRLGGRLNALVNNAAIQILGGVDDLSADDWHETLAVNLVTPFLLLQGLSEDLESAVGAVVNVASIHASATKPGFVAYATSKAALVGLTRSTAVDLGARIRVNAVCPAAVATPMLMAGFTGKETSFANLASCHPAGRVATPEEVAAVVAFLVSNESSFVTGAAWAVDGGIGGRLHDPE